MNFITFYLKQEQNPFLIITAYSFQLFPYYNFLSKREKDLFYEYNDETIVKKYILKPYDTEEKITTFCESILYELRKAKINSVSPSLINFLLNKTFNGIPQFIKELILSLYDNHLVYITKNQNKQLVEDERFKKMLYYNDFTELNIPDIIQKKVGAIIDNFLDKLEIYILKLASIIGNIFDLAKLKQALRIDNSANAALNILKDSGENFLYEKLCALEENNIISILYDLDIKKKYVICKFSIPFLREVLYQRTPTEYRNQMHYVIGKLVKVSTMNKSHQKFKHMDETMELGILEKHLKYSQVSIHDNFLNGKLSTTQINNDNYLNINNLKTLIIRQICAKIKSIKINDDKNNMIKAGYIYKKSDGKLTWEYRYFVLTTNRVLYFYNENDYLERKSPLGIFYLQNLFNVKLLTDGSVGGKKNIISLIVNEWFKKGEVMKYRVYYLSVEEREESFKWVITFNILKIKAFYEKYCFGFGYVNFPLYESNKNEFILKQKKSKFKFPQNKIFNQIFKGRQNAKRHSIYSPYLSLGKVENRLNTIEFENYVIKQILVYIKYIVIHSICIFFGNIQLGLSKNSNEYEDSKIYAKFRNEDVYDFINPIFYDNLIEKEERDEKIIRRNIEILTLKYKEAKKNNNIYATNKNDYTEKQLTYFNKYYKNYFINPEKINIIKKKNIKYLHDIQTVKLVNSGQIKGFNIDYLGFKNSEEAQIDREDYLKYIEYTDNDGRLKDQYRRIDSGSIAKNSKNSKNSNNSNALHRKTKFDYFSKRESMFDTDEATNNINNSEIQNQNNEKNCPIINLLNRKNNERKKKLLNNELEIDRRNSKIRGSSDMSSSKYDSSEEARKINKDENNNKLLILDNLESNYKESKNNIEKNKENINNNKIINKTNSKRKSQIKNHSKSTSKNKNRNNKNKKKNDNKKEEKIIINNNDNDNGSFESIESKKNIFSKFSLGRNSNNNEEIKFISDIKNVVSDNKNTDKSDKFEDKNESGKFGESEGNFKELLKKLIEDKKATQKPKNISRKSNSKKKGKEIINTLVISEKKNKKEKNEKKENININNENGNENDNFSMKNNSGCLMFTLNGDNEKSEKIEENNNNNSKVKNGFFEINEEKEEEREDEKEEEKEKKKKKKKKE